MFLMFIGIPILLRIINVLFGIDFQDTSGSFRIIVLFMSLLINLSICFYICYIVRFEQRQSLVNLGLTVVNLTDNIKEGLKKYAITLPFIMLAGYLVNIISSYFKVSPDIQDVVKWVLDEDSTFVLTILAFFGTVIAPVMEEIIFRGFLIPALKGRLGVRYAILISAAIFAAVHMDKFAFLQIFILGILLGYLYEKTQSIAASVVVHILHNSLTITFLMYFKFFLKGKVPVF